MKGLVVILFSLFTLVGFSQEQDTLKQLVLSPAQMQEDFNLYRRLLEETHPGLYRYATKEMMQTKFDSISASLESEMMFYDFYKTITALAADIRCAHSYVIPTDDINSYTSSIRSIPFFLFPINEKPHVLFNGTLDPTIKPGFELVKVNDQPMDSISKIMKRHMWSDGNIELGKNQVFTGSSFWLFYYSLIERSDTFDLSFKDLTGNEVSVKVPAQSKEITERNYGKNPVNDRVLKLYNQKTKKPWQLEFLKEMNDVAVLRFNAFGGKGMNYEEQAQKAMQKFMDSSLKKIKQEKSKFLIVDVRDNQGGWDVHGVELLTYLIKEDEPFEYFSRSFAVTDSTKFLKYSDLSEYEQEHVKDELIEEVDGTFTLKREKDVYDPKPNRFKGEIYFLINERTGSAAAEFVSLAKSNQVGVFVGRETSGTYEGGNGGSFIKLGLPNSGIFVRTPLLAGFTAVKPTEVKGRGTMPNHVVVFTRDDLLNRYDRQMEFVKNLIRKTQER